MSGIPKKYTFKNSIMQLNPNYKRWEASRSGTNTPLTKPYNNRPLAIVSSMDDVVKATEEQYKANGVNMRLAQSTVAALEIMQDEEFTEEFKQPGGGLDGSELLDGLVEYFVQYEIPVGMINKLMALQLYHLRFIIDDSGSMNASTDGMLNEASEHVLRGLVPCDTTHMTRWQEAETRLHNMMDILAYIPTKSIEIRFLNADKKIYLQRVGKTTVQFLTQAHAQIAQTFSKITPTNGTPTLCALAESLSSTEGSIDPYLHYLFTDGVPTDCQVQDLKDLVMYRNRPEHNPITFISCTDVDADAEWMKQVEEVAPFCSELDDFRDEREEVLNDQGEGFPYTKGYWLISQLVSVINPHDLDAIDENLPFTKSTLDNLLGRVHTPQEYQYYFERNPHASIYLDLYKKFLTEATFARNFVSRAEQVKRERKAGYRDGARTKKGISVSKISSKLQKITSSVGRIPILGDNAFIV